MREHVKSWKISIAAIAIALLATTSAANSTDSICEAVALYNTRESEHFPYALNRGETIDAITQYNVDKKTGSTSLCSHGGGCYPANALQLSNCVVDKSKPTFENDDEISYSLDLIRSKVAPDKLRQNDVELRLLDLGSMRRQCRRLLCQDASLPLRPASSKGFGRRPERHCRAEGQFP
jgi:hypothetical protein